MSAAPIGVLPSKNCTLATVPGAVSLAFALIVMLAPTREIGTADRSSNTRTVGGALLATLIVTADEVVAAPDCQVARAVSVCEPAVAFGKVAA